MIETIDCLFNNIYSLVYKNAIFSGLRTASELHDAFNSVPVETSYFLWKHWNKQMLNYGFVSKLALNDIFANICPTRKGQL